MMTQNRHMIIIILIIMIIIIIISRSYSGSYFPEIHAFDTLIKSTEVFRLTFYKVLLPHLSTIF